MTIYIDNDFACHAEDIGGCRAFDVEFFNNKCATYISGYRYVPSGETWTRSDGVQFSGEMISVLSHVDKRFLDAAQTQYEIDKPLMDDMQNALALLGVTNE